jgi:hypothetical protein
MDTPLRHAPTAGRNIGFIFIGQTRITWPTCSLGRQRCRFYHKINPLSMRSIISIIDIYHYFSMIGCLIDTNLIFFPGEYASPFQAGGFEVH